MGLRAHVCPSLVARCLPVDAPKGRDFLARTDAAYPRKIGRPPDVPQAWAVQNVTEMGGRLDAKALHGILLELRTLATGAPSRRAKPLPPSARPYVEYAQTQGVGALCDLIMAKVDLLINRVDDPRDRRALHALAKGFGLDQAREPIGSIDIDPPEHGALAERSGETRRKAFNRAAERVLPYLVAEVAADPSDPPAPTDAGLHLVPRERPSPRLLKEAEPLDMMVALESLTALPRAFDSDQRQRVRLRVMASVAYRSGKAVEQLPPRIRRHVLHAEGLDDTELATLAHGYALERLDDTDLELLLACARRGLGPSADPLTTESVLGTLLLQLRMRQFDVGGAERSTRKLRETALRLSSEFGRLREDGRFWPAAMTLFWSNVDVDLRMQAAVDASIIASGLCVPRCGLETLQAAQRQLPKLAHHELSLQRWQRRLAVARAGVRVRGTIQALSREDLARADRVLGRAREDAALALDVPVGPDQEEDVLWARLRLAEVDAVSTLLLAAQAREDSAKRSATALGTLANQGVPAVTAAANKTAFELAAFQRRPEALQAAFAALQAQTGVIDRHPRWNLLIRLVAEAAQTWPEPTQLDLSALPPLPPGFVGYRLRTQIPLLTHHAAPQKPPRTWGPDEGDDAMPSI